MAPVGRYLEDEFLLKGPPVSSHVSGKEGRCKRDLLNLLVVARSFLGGGQETPFLLGFEGKLEGDQAFLKAPLF